MFNNKHSLYVFLYETRFLSTVSFAITLVSLTRIRYNAIDKWMNDVCITQTFAYAFPYYVISTTSVKIQGWMTSQVLL
jgi:hypothetical protein